MIADVKSVMTQTITNHNRRHFVGTGSCVQTLHWPDGWIPVPPEPLTRWPEALGCQLLYSVWLLWCPGSPSVSLPPLWLLVALKEYRFIKLFYYIIVSQWSSKEFPLSVNTFMSKVTILALLDTMCQQLQLSCGRPSQIVCNKGVILET